MADVPEAGGTETQFEDISKSLETAAMSTQWRSNSMLRHSKMVGNPSLEIIELFTRGLLCLSGTRTASEVEAGTEQANNTSKASRVCVKPNSGSTNSAP